MTDQRADDTLVVLSEGNALTGSSKGEHLCDSYTYHNIILQ